MKFKEGIAYEEDVIKRAKELLEEDYGQEMSEEDISKTFDILLSYLKRRLSQAPYLTIRFPHLGRLYYPSTTCNKRYHQRANAIYGNKETNQRAAEIWRERYDTIEQAYQDWQPRINRSRTYRLLHILAPFTKKAKLRGFEIEDIEKLQNGIE